MSAAALLSASAGASAPSALLRRRGAEPAALAPHNPMRVDITADLAWPAQACTEAATGRAAISVQLCQGHGQPEVLATLWLGDDYDAMQAAHERARTLQAGDAVRVRGEGLRMRYHHGALALLVCTVHSIERACPAAHQGAAA